MSGGGRKRYDIVGICTKFSLGVFVWLWIEGVYDTAMSYILSFFSFFFFLNELRETQPKSVSALVFLENMKMCKAQS